MPLPDYSKVKGIRDMPSSQDIAFGMLKDYELPDGGEENNGRGSGRVVKR